MSKILGMGWICIFAFAAITAHADDVCMKDGKEVTVAGKDTSEKKAACKTAGGTWTKKKEKEKPKTSGDGGGW